MSESHFTGGVDDGENVSLDAITLSNDRVVSQTFLGFELKVFVWPSPCQ